MKPVLLKIALAVVTAIAVAVAFYVNRAAIHTRAIKQIRAELTSVRVDDGRHDRARLLIYNPTDWELFSSRDDQTTFVEYFLLKGEYREFLLKDEVKNRLRAKNHSDFHLNALAVAPAQITHVSSKTPLVQRVTIRFDRAQKGDEVLKLDPEFEFINEREFFFHQSGYVEEVDPSDPFHFGPEAAGQVTIQAFATRVKREWQEYADYDDVLLVGAVVNKWPVYRGRIGGVDRAILTYRLACSKALEPNPPSDYFAAGVLALMNEFGDPK